MNEVEATLIICSENPQEDVATIAALSSIEGYALTPVEPIRIQDYYVDSPDRALHTADFSLRLRETDTTLWLTLKGPPRSLEEGIVEHLEIEAPWGDESIRSISIELAQQGIGLPPVPDIVNQATPSAVLAQWGLEMVQRRENYRQVRNLRPVQEEASQTLAELSIDSVVYHFDSRVVRHYEVEIEAKTPSGIKILSPVVHSLTGSYPSFLQRWGHGKLSTGKAIELLLHQGALEGLLGPHDQLRPQAYPEIHRLLSASKA
jgi:hypothetical protein